MSMAAPPVVDHSEVIGRRSMREAELVLRLRASFCPKCLKRTENVRRITNDSAVCEFAIKYISVTAMVRKMLWVFPAATL